MASGSVAGCGDHERCGFSFPPTAGPQSPPSVSPEGIPGSRAGRAGGGRQIRTHVANAGAVAGFLIAGTLLYRMFRGVEEASTAGPRSPPAIGSRWGIPGPRAVGCEPTTARQVNAGAVDAVPITRPHRAMLPITAIPDRKPSSRRARPVRRGLAANLNRPYIQRCVNHRTKVIPFLIAASSRSKRRCNVHE
jgi:hypothetical protein